MSVVALRSITLAGQPRVVGELFDWPSTPAALLTAARRNQVREADPHGMSWPCGQCARSFVSGAALGLHREAHHRGEDL